jgi:DNA-binding transcriptional MocR family regulator
MKLYLALAQELGAMIRGGTLRAGEKLPSVREFCRTRGVSPATVLHTYDILVSQGLIESSPRSGYYVLEKPKTAAVPRTSTPKADSTRVLVSDLVFDTLEATRDSEVIPLGSAFPSPALFPWSKLARYLGGSARHMNPWSTVASLPPGDLDLRRQIARRYLRLGMTIGVEQIIITAGALEALNLSLQTLTRPGDTIAIESPTFYGCLQAAERLRLQVVEIPTHPHEGVDLAGLSRAIAKHPIRACWFMTTLHHPTGATAPPEKKRDLVRLLAGYGIPLIEDDAYAELQYSSSPSPPAKAFDSKGWVLHCGSFSKCLAPGYRLGWLAAGRFTREVARQKIESSLATSLPIQQGIAQMLHHGGYEAHLARLREVLGSQQAAALNSVQRHFPPGFRVARPLGGYFLWIECAASVDALEVHRLAVESGISIAPGPMFSARRQFGNFLRLNCGHPWTSRMDGAVQRIGEILRRGN